MFILRNHSFIKCHLFHTRSSSCHLHRYCPSQSDQRPRRASPTGIFPGGATQPEPSVFTLLLLLVLSTPSWLLKAGCVTRHNFTWIKQSSPDVLSVSTAPPACISQLDFLCQSQQNQPAKPRGNHPGSAREPRSQAVGHKTMKILEVLPRRTHTRLRTARKHQWFAVSAKVSLPPGRACRGSSHAPGRLSRRGGFVGIHSLTFSVEAAARQERRCWTKRAEGGTLGNAGVRAENTDIAIDPATASRGLLPVTHPVGG